MDKILKLIIENFHKQKPNAEYKLALNNICKVETVFMDSLDKKQKSEYLELESLCGELSTTELNEFAEFLFKQLYS